MRRPPLQPETQCARSAPGPESYDATRTATADDPRNASLTRATAAFALLLTVIVVTANLGLGRQVFSFLIRIPGGDFTGHLVLMGILSFLVNTTYLNRHPHATWRATLGVTGAVAGLVLVEELSQLLLIHRGFSLSDLAADALGIGAFALLARRLHGIRTADCPTPDGHAQRAHPSA